MLQLATLLQVEEQSELELGLMLIVNRYSVISISYLNCVSLGFRRYS